jgi:hypothetical protein
MKSSALVANLPTRVLREIFIQYLHLPTYKNTSQPAVRWSRLTFSTPVTLSHVCHKWRQVACSYPLLWSSLFVFGPSRKQLPLVDQWLQRSRTTPLDIQFAFAFFKGTPVDNLNDITMVMQLFMDHHNRWRDVWFDLSNFRILFPPGVPCPIPNLSRLPQLQLDSAFLNAPVEWNNISHIKEVCDQFFWHRSLSSLTTCFQSPDSFVAHPRLRELICSRTGSWSNILDILVQCPNLEVLKMGLEVPKASPTISLQHTKRPIVHRSLQKFVLHTFDKPDNAIPVLYNLTAPNLVEFDVPTEDGSIELVNELCNMILRSNCRLIVLGELAVDKYPEKYISFLHSPCLQSLQQLSLNFATSSVLECLTIPSRATQRPLLPHLKYLEVDQVVRPLNHSLSDMLLSRFDTLVTANIVAYSDISQEPLDNKLWSHPGYRIVRQMEDSAGIEILEKYSRNRNPWVGPTLPDLETFKPQPVFIPLSPTSH